MKVLGIIGNPGSECHNSSAALVIDSVVVAAAEQERFSRRKHALGGGPLMMRYRIVWNRRTNIR